ncbi:MAG: hypothetical protein JNN04_14385 [Cyclobacteriaceae bacterium]|nr:hypothetical protein [Cyclobacteriaceae bacterium]
MKSTLFLVLLAMTVFANSSSAQVQLTSDVLFLPVKQDDIPAGLYGYKLNGSKLTVYNKITRRELTLKKVPLADQKINEGALFQSQIDGKINFSILSGENRLVFGNNAQLERAFLDSRNKEYFEIDLKSVDSASSVFQVALNVKSFKKIICHYISFDLKQIRIIENYSNSGSYKLNIPKNNSLASRFYLVFSNDNFTHNIVFIFNEQKHTDEMNVMTMPIDSIMKTRYPHFLLPGTMKLPGYHPVSKLKDGDMSVVDGIVVARNPSVKPKATYFCGVPAEAQPSLDLNDSTTMTTVNLRKVYLDMRLKMLDAYLEIEGRKKLKALYEGLTKSLDSLDQLSQAPQYKTSAFSKILTKALVEELSILRPYPKALEQLYKDKAPLSMKRISRKKEKALEDGFNVFLSGEYFSYEKANITDINFRLTPTNIVNIPYASFIKESPKVISRNVGQKEFVAFNMRVYTGEHSVLDSELNSIFEMVGLVHTSIVTVGFALLKQNQEYSIDRGRTWMQRTKFSHEYIGTWTANGAASWFESNDTYHLKMDYYFGTYDDFKKGIYQVIPGSDGTCRRIRAASYSVGLYGLNWICHSVVNSFALRKWNITPVNYFTNLVYMVYGNQGISSHDGYGTNVVKGCVPGAGCYWLKFAPTPTPLHLVQELFMGEGRGTFLSSYYNPCTGNYQTSDASYKSVYLDFDPTLINESSVFYQDGWSN